MAAGYLHHPWQGQKGIQVLEVSHIEGCQMAGPLKQRWHLGWQAGREEDKMLYQDRLHHQIPDCGRWGGHVWGWPCQTGPWSTQTAWCGMRSYVTGTQWTFWCRRMVDQWPQQGSGRGPETCSDRNKDTVLCKSNANIFRRNLQLFLAFWWKNIEFSTKGHDNSWCLLFPTTQIFEHQFAWNENWLWFFKGKFTLFDKWLRPFERNFALYLLCSTLPRIFLTIICSVWICRDGFFLMSLQCVSFTTNSCPFI